MTQKLCRRLEDLERIGSAAAARRLVSSSDYEQKIAAMMEEVHAWDAVPENQKWLAEQPPEYLRNQMQALRQQLAEIASGHRGGVAA